MQLKFSFYKSLKQLIGDEKIIFELILLYGLSGSKVFGFEISDCTNTGQADLFLCFNYFCYTVFLNFVPSYEFKSTNYEFKSTSYEFKCMSYEF